MFDYSRQKPKWSIWILLLHLDNETWEWNVSLRYQSIRTCQKNPHLLTWYVHQNIFNPPYYMIFPSKLNQPTKWPKDSPEQTCTSFCLNYVRLVTTFPSQRTLVTSTNDPSLLWNTINIWPPTRCYPRVITIGSDAEHPSVVLWNTFL